jgi:uncharacterized membrane protein YjgN (DUF898 family)
MITIGMLWLVIRLKWALRAHAWFWIAIAAVGISHIALVLFIPWPAAWMPVVLMTGISTIDFLFILWVIAVVERLMEKPVQQRRS